MENSNFPKAHLYTNKIKNTNGVLCSSKQGPSKILQKKNGPIGEIHLTIIKNKKSKTQKKGKRNENVLAAREGSSHKVRETEAKQHD